MNKVITISRQYGSGGREVGKLLADAYGIPFYDNEIITRAAKETYQQPFVFTGDGYECVRQPGSWICRIVIR